MKNKIIRFPKNTDDAEIAELAEKLEEYRKIEKIVLDQQEQQASLLIETRELIKNHEERLRLKRKLASFTKSS